MPVIQFIGSLLPVESGISIYGRPVGCDINGSLVKISPHIIDSRVNVTCEVAQYSKGDDLLHVYIRALEVTRSLADLAAFSKGLGLTVILERIVYPDDSIDAINFRDPDLASRCKSFDIDDENSFTEMVEIVLKDRSLLTALNEVVSSITVLGHSETGCARAMERLKHIIAPGMKRHQRWKALRDNLQISETYLTSIIDPSTGPRHGDPSLIDVRVREQTVQRAWTIMDRFLEFERRHNQPLPISDFPML